MDLSSQIAIVVVTIIGGVLAFVAVTMIDWGVISDAATGKCDAWSDELDLKIEEFNARQKSFWGQLDLEGEIAADRAALEHEIDEFDAECVQ